MGNSINILLDNLLALLWRVLDLPLYAILGFILIIIVCTTFVFRKFFKGVSKQKIWIFNLVLVVFAIVFIVDKKFSDLKKENDFLNDKYAKAIMNEASINKINKLYDLNALSNLLPKSNITEKAVNAAIDLITIRQRDPNSMSFIAVVDLNNPKIKVNVTSKKAKKILTSEFAKQTESILAINGEAGETPHMGAPLGEWTGNWISNGKPVLLEDSDKRPFMSFSKQNEAKYFEEKIVDTVLNDEKYNTIWGRFDILKEKEVVTHKGDKQYARTIMGINAEGNVLYLMVVDGKRPEYSLGLEYFKCAEILKSLGAYNAMSCDQGGSSCMYLKPMGGIINRPGDSGGIERPIYSHFGISFD